MTVTADTNPAVHDQMLQPNTEESVLDQCVDLMMMNDSGVTVDQIDELLAMLETDPAMIEDQMWDGAP